VDVGDVLRDRTAGPKGLERMIVLSLVLHAGALVALMFGARGWAIQAPPPKTVMTISLNGGNEGPENGGMTSIGGRPIQEVLQATPLKTREPIRPPADITPEMTLPAPVKPKPKTAPKPAPQVKETPKDARGQTPTRGPEVRQGTAVAETGARGQGFGLSTSGGIGNGARLDVADFCCPEYVEQMVQRIRANWDQRAEVRGVTIVKYTIQRNGTITNADVEQSSGYTQLDLNALRAVMTTRQLPPLPSAFSNATLPVHLTFEYGTR
jgi:protein TonB